ncbi:20734_t:CDS:2, partial [Gigaspora rosea]
REFRIRRIEEMLITPKMNNCIKNLPITGYTLITLFRFSNPKYMEITDKTYREGIKREDLEKINIIVNDYKLQLYIIHEYLSKNRSGTEPVLQTDKLQEAKFLVQVPMYFYLMSIDDQTK